MFRKLIARNITNRKKEVMLGRWKLDHSDNVWNKIDRSNEDHCGVCSELRKEYIQKNTSLKNPSSNNPGINNISLEYKRDYYLPFCI